MVSLYSLINYVIVGWAAYSKVRWEVVKFLIILLHSALSKGSTTCENHCQEKNNKSPPVIEGIYYVFA